MEGKTKTEGVFLLICWYSARLTDPRYEGEVIPHSPQRKPRAPAGLFWFNVAKHPDSIYNPPHSHYKSPFSKSRWYYTPFEA